MQQTSALYDQLLRQPHTTEVRCVIAGVTYSMDRLVAESVSAQLFAGSSPEVGSCVAAKLEMTILPDLTAIPRNAEIQLYARLRSGEAVSEWLPEGVYYIFRRAASTLAGANALKITAYDCIAKLNQIYLGGTITGWPKTMRAVAQDIAQRIGTTIDSRTVISDTWLCQIDTTLTMAEYMGYIAAAHGGSWISTPTGQLRLVSAFDIPAETNLLINEYGDALVFGDARILV